MLQAEELKPENVVTTEDNYVEERKNYTLEKVAVCTKNVCKKINKEASDENDNEEKNRSVPQVGKEKGVVAQDQQRDDDLGDNARYTGRSGTNEVLFNLGKFNTKIDFHESWMGALNTIREYKLENTYNLDGECGEGSSCGGRVTFVSGPMKSSESIYDIDKAYYGIIESDKHNTLEWNIFSIDASFNVGISSANVLGASAGLSGSVGGKIKLTLPTDHETLNSETVWDALPKRLKRIFGNFFHRDNYIGIMMPLPFMDYKDYIKTFPPGSEIELETRGNIQTSASANITSFAKIFGVPLGNTVRFVYYLFDMSYKMTYKTLYHPTKNLIKVRVEDIDLADDGMFLDKLQSNTKYKEVSSTSDIGVHLWDENILKAGLSVDIFKIANIEREDIHFVYEYIFDLSYPAAKHAFEEIFMSMSFVAADRMATLSYADNYNGVLLNKREDNYTMSKVYLTHAGLQFNDISWSLQLKLAKMKQKFNNDRFGLIYYKDNEVSTDIKKKINDNLKRTIEEDRYRYNRLHRWQWGFGYMDNYVKYIDINSEVERFFSVDEFLGLHQKERNRVLYTYSYKDIADPETAIEYFYSTAEEILGHQNALGKKIIKKAKKENKCKGDVTVKVDLDLYDDAIEELLKTNINQLWYTLAKHIDYEEYAKRYMKWPQSGILIPKKLCFSDIDTGKKQCEKNLAQNKIFIHPVARDRFKYQMKECKKSLGRSLCKGCKKKFVTNHDCIEVLQKIKIAEKIEKSMQDFKAYNELEYGLNQGEADRVEAINSEIKRQNELVEEMAKVLGNKKKQNYFWHYLAQYIGYEDLARRFMKWPKHGFNVPKEVCWVNGKNKKKCSKNLIDNKMFIFPKVRNALEDQMRECKRSLIKKQCKNCKKNKIRLTNNICQKTLHTILYAKDRWAEIEDLEEQAKKTPKTDLDSDSIDYLRKSSVQNFYNNLTKRLIRNDFDDYRRFQAKILRDILSSDDDGKFVMKFISELISDGAYCDEESYFHDMAIRIVLEGTKPKNCKIEWYQQGHYGDRRDELDKYILRCGRKTKKTQ